MKITKISLLDKINKLENEINFYKKIIENYSDVEIIELAGKSYYASNMALQQALDTEFIVSKASLKIEKHSIAIYKDIENTRVYGKDLNNLIYFPLFTIINNRISCFNFKEILEKNSVSDEIYKKIYIYIIDFIKSKDNLKLMESNLPKVISQSLIFS